MANINIRVNEEVKNEADNLFNKLGLNMSTAINIFLVKAINTNSIPFDVNLEIPNAETRLALEEGKKIAKDKTRKTFKNTKELKEFLENGTENWYYYKI